MTILYNRKTGARKILLFVCGALYKLHAKQQTAVTINYKQTADNCNDYLQTDSRQLQLHYKQTAQKLQLLENNLNLLQLLSVQYDHLHRSKIYDAHQLHIT